MKEWNDLNEQTEWGEAPAYAFLKGQSIFLERLGRLASHFWRAVLIDEKFRADLVEWIKERLNQDQGVEPEQQ